MHALQELIAERVSSGLRRKTLTKPSRWAKQYRVMGRPFPGPWTFKYHPWLKEMHDSEASANVGQKSAQMGYTETVLNIAFYKIDVEGTDCLYILPAKTPDASDFSASRFDPAVELSPHLSKLFTDVKNIGHKRAGTTNVYIRGSKSRSGLKSVPVGFIICDEVDEMVQENIPLAFERSSGQQEKQSWMISTPTIDNFGINKEFEASTKEQFFFKCPGCSRWTHLIFPECVEIVGEDFNDPKIKESFYKCKECSCKLEQELKTEWLSESKWIPEYTNRDTRGFLINQLYSTTISPGEFVESYFRGQRDPSSEQEFFNSKLGIPHVVDGARVIDKHLDACTGDYLKKDKYGSGLITMGVDVGTWLNVEIVLWKLPKNPIGSIDVNVQSHARVIFEGKFLHFEDLDKLMRQYSIQFCVIDANPERRKAYEFACRFWGHVKLCFYGRGIQGKQIHLGKEDETTITVDRTSWLDLALGRFHNNSITIPKDTSMDYRSHVKALVRIYEKDIDGNPIGKYVNGSNEDHYAHARNYSEIALPLATSLSESHNIAGIF